MRLSDLWQTRTKICAALTLASATAACIPPPEESRTPDTRDSTGSSSRVGVGTDEVQGAASGSISKVMGCYANDSSFGWVKLTLHIGRSGHVDKFEDAGSTVPDGVVACIQGVLGVTSFPACRSCGGYEYRFEFHEEPAATEDERGGAPLLPSQGQSDAGRPLTPDPDDKWL